MQFLTEWIDGAPNAAAVERATMCRLRVMVGRVNSCSYHDDRDESSHEYVAIPAVHLAEGIARDWWAIFGGRDGKRSIWPYRTGFILPCLSLSCDGSSFEISGEQMHCDNPGLRFWQAGSEAVARHEAESELARFVETVVQQLSTSNICESEVQLRWSRVSKSRQDPEESSFCEAAGALGADPYFISDADADFILQSGTLFSDVTLADFLAGVKPLNQEQREWTLDAVTSAEQRLEEKFRLPELCHAADEVDVGLKQRRAGEGAWGPAYRLARAFREVIAVASDEELGSIKNIASKLGNEGFARSDSLYGVDAVVSRHDDLYVHLRSSRFLTPWTENFNFARAVGDVVCFPEGGPSVVNDLHGAERQAMSRAFAAEFLAPIESVLEMSQEVSNFEEIAGKFSVSPKVIELQLQNCKRIQQACTQVPVVDFG